MTSTAMTSTAMPPTAMPKRARLSLAIVAGLIAMSLLWGHILLSDLRDHGEATRQKESELRALQQRSGPRGISGAGTSNPADPFLEGASASLASNALQERVVRIIEEAGGNVTSVNVEQQQASQGPAGRRLILQVTAEMAIEGLQRALHKLEGEAPALIVEGLIVDRRTTGAERDDPERPTRLRVDARIAGFTRAGGNP